MNNLDIIKQYIDTGLVISEYQLEKLSPNQLKTYFRKRIIANNPENDHTFTSYEYSIMDRETLKKAIMTGKSVDILTAHSSLFETKLEGMVFNSIGNINLHECLKIPKDVKFNNLGYVNLKYVSHISDGVEFNNRGNVNIERTRELNIKEFNNEGDVFLDNLKRFKGDITFNNKGFVEADNIIEFEYKATFNNNGYVSLFYAQKLNENVRFLNNGDIRLETLVYLPNRFKFENKGNVSLTSIDFKEGEIYEIEFNNKGNIDLDSEFKILPHGVKFNNSGYIILYKDFNYDSLGDERFLEIYNKLIPSLKTTTLYKRYENIVNKKHNKFNK